MTPTPRSARPRAERDRRRHRPSPREGRRRLPTEVPRPRRRGLPLRLVSPHQRPSTGRRPPRTSGAGRRIRVSVSSMRSPRLPAGCGAGQPRRLPRPLVSGQVGAGKGPVRGKPRAGPVVGPRRVFDNPVVGHASISNSRVCVVVAISISLRTRGETSALPVEGGDASPRSRGMGGPHASHDAAGRGTDGRLDHRVAPVRSAAGALGPRVGEAVGSAWSSPQGHGVDA